jgi:hypothetical protein
MAVVHEERRVRLGLNEAQCCHMTDETLEPRPWCLSEAIEGARQKTHVVRVLRINEAGRLLAVHLFLQIAVKKGI